MAWTQADIDALKAAIATGALSVTFADRSVTYKSTDEQLKVLALMQSEVLGGTSNAPRNHRLASVSKGV